MAGQTAAPPRGLAARVRRRALKLAGTPLRVREYRRILAELRGPQERQVFERLRAVPGFDNGSAHATLMCEAYNMALEGGDVLECGPGLSTLVLEAAARQTGATVHSLEHSVYWAKRTRRFLRVVGAERVRLHRCDIVDHGDYDWYRLPEDLPQRFTLVLCDGPPGVIRGGRYGVVPTMGDAIGAATLLVDDVDRPGERAALERWQAEFGRPFRIRQVGEEPALGIVAPPGGP